MLKGVKLCVVTNRQLARGRSNREVVKDALAGGADLIQYREKEASTREMIKEGRELLKLTRRAGVSLIINDRVDVALAIAADGVHLGQDDLPLEDARRLIGSDKIIGISTHNLQEAVAAERGGADYLGFGAIFPTETKRDSQLKGLVGLREIKTVIKIPVLAIGGISLDNVNQVREAGADGVAVVSAIVAAPDPAAATARFKNVFKNRG